MPYRAPAALVLGSWRAGLLPWRREACSGTQVAYGIIVARITRSNSAVLVRIGGDVGDKFLRRKREEPARRWSV